MPHPEGLLQQLEVNIRPAGAQEKAEPSQGLIEEATEVQASGFTELEQVDDAASGEPSNHKASESSHPSQYLEESIRITLQESAQLNLAKEPMPAQLLDDNLIHHGPPIVLRRQSLDFEDLKMKRPPSTIQEVSEAQMEETDLNKSSIIKNSLDISEQACQIQYHVPKNVFRGKMTSKANSNVTQSGAITP